MRSVQLADNLSVSAQLDAQDYAVLAARGVRTVINNRPDGEDPGQPTAAEATRLAEAQGLDYHHQPVRVPSLSLEDVQRFGALLRDSPGPVHAHCKSGLRSAMLWGADAVLSGRMSPEALVAHGDARGLDLRPAVAWLQRNGLPKG